MNVKEQRFVGVYNLKSFAIPPREPNVFYYAMQDIQAGCKSSFALGIPTPVLVWYLTNEAQSDTCLERDSIQRAAEGEYHAMLLGAFTCCVL